MRRSFRLAPSPCAGAAVVEDTSAAEVVGVVRIGSIEAVGARSDAFAPGSAVLAGGHTWTHFKGAIQGIFGRVAKMVEIGGAGPEAWWSGSGGEVKVGGGAVEGLPAVNPAHGDLTRGQERPEQHGGGLGAG
jgi:hypothetical protein